MSESNNNRVLLALLETRIQLEEELHAINILIPNWDTTTRVKALTNTIAVLLSNEPSNEELMDETFDVTKPDLLEMVLNNLEMTQKTSLLGPKLRLTHPSPR